MEVVRNSINIVGLADESILPDRIHGQMIQYSETDTIRIDDNQPGINSIYQVVLNVNIYESRSIKTPVGDTLVLDGRKTIKIIYTQKLESGKATFIELFLPFNTFVEVSDNAKIENINIYIIDAYFELLDERRIYSHIVYLVDVMTKKEAKQNGPREIKERNEPMNNYVNNIIDSDLSAESNQNDMGYIKVDLEEEYL